MNKRAVYKIFTFAITPILCTALFIVPVHAEGDMYYPDPYSYTAYNHFFYHGYNHLLLTSSDSTTYNVNLGSSGSVSGSESGQEHTTGTINSNGSSTLGAKYMTCTTNTGTSASQTYSCYFSNRSSGVSNSQSINIGFNENTYTSVNNSISLTQNTDITGSITTSESTYFYSYIPWLKGTYTPDTSWSWDNGVRVTKDNPVRLIFLTKSNIINANRTISFYNHPSYSGTPSYVYDCEIFGHLYLWEIKIYNQDDNAIWTVPSINGIESRDICPLYYGYQNRMPDSVAELIGLRKSVGYILNNGNDNTNTSVGNATDAKNEVNNKINSFDQIENNQVSDMESQINNINVQSDLMTNNNFLSSAQWVKTQFDRITVSTPIGSVLSFSLILGLALIFLGKIR